LFHNLLKFEDEASFARLFQIIELEVGVHEKGHHRVGKEPMNQAQIEGRERFGDLCFKRN
jgi:hypothetical protein